MYNLRVVIIGYNIVIFIIIIIIVVKSVYIVFLITAIINHAYTIHYISILHNIVHRIDLASSTTVTHFFFTPWNKRPKQKQ